MKTTFNAGIRLIKESPVLLTIIITGLIFWNVFRRV